MAAVRKPSQHVHALVAAQRVTCSFFYSYVLFTSLVSSREWIVPDKDEKVRDMLLEIVKLRPSISPISSSKLLLVIIMLAPL